MVNSEEEYLTFVRTACIHMYNKYYYGEVQRDNKEGSCDGGLWELRAKQAPYESTIIISLEILSVVWKHGEREIGTRLVKSKNFLISFPPSYSSFFLSENKVYKDFDIFLILILVKLAITLLLVFLKNWEYDVQVSFKSWKVKRHNLLNSLLFSLRRFNVQNYY